MELKQLGSLNDASSLILDVFLEAGFPISAAGAFQQYVEDREEGLQVEGAFESGKLIGVVAWSLLSGTLSVLAVDKEHRRQGVATALLAHVIECTEKEEVGRLTISTLSDSVEALEHMGFDEAGEGILLHEFRMQPMEYLLQRSMLGRSVKVVIEQTVGSFHPYYADQQYPCNYGYIEDEGVMEGVFKNAYVLGEEEPVDTAEGTVIGILYHSEDSSVRYLVNTMDSYDKQEVINTVGELEQYYNTRIIWLKDSRN